MVITFGVAVALFTMWQEQEQANVAQTIEVLLAVETQDFKASYRNAAEWLHDHEGPELPSEAATAHDMQVVLEGYSLIIAFSKQGYLEREVVESTIRIKACQFYRSMVPRLRAQGALDEWEELTVFCGIAG